MKSWKSCGPFFLSVHLLPQGTRRRRMTSLIHGTRTNASEQRLGRISGAWNGLSMPFLQFQSVLDTATLPRRRGNMHSASRDKSSADQDAPPVREEKSDSIRNRAAMFSRGQCLDSDPVLSFAWLFVGWFVGSFAFSGRLSMSQQHFVICPSLSRMPSKQVCM